MPTVEVYRFNYEISLKLEKHYNLLINYMIFFSLNHIQINYRIFSFLDIKKSILSSDKKKCLNSSKDNKTL